MKRALLVVAAVASLAHRARADGPLGPNGSPVRTSSYAVDLAGGPVLAGSRALGLAGAYVAIAEGVDGNVHNPAAPAVRAAWSSTHVDYDATLGLLFPGTLASTDFYNTGRGQTDLRRSDPREFALLAPAGNLQVGPWGAGLGLELFRYGLLRQPNPALGGEEEVVRAQFSTVRTFLARAVDDGQMVGGIGLHVTALDVTTKDEIVTREGNLFTTRGVSLEGGLLWRPTGERFRLGLAVRAPVTTDVDARGKAVGGDIVLRDPASPNAFWMPRRVKRPWSADVGVAVQLGPRPLNVGWLDPVVVMRRVDRHLERRERSREQRLERAERLGPDAAAEAELELDRESDADARYRARQRERLGELLRQRYAELPRSYVLLSAALHADGDVANAVGVESFLQGYVDRSGESVTLTPRLGAETEVVPSWVKLRGGSYLEPSRFRGGTSRLHGTFGFDARLFEWSLFGLLHDDERLALGAAIDGARQYLGWAVSLGIWR
jgi:hypothetical protein